MFSDQLDSFYSVYMKFILEHNVEVNCYGITLVIISMTKLLDADWFRGVFFQNKQNGGKAEFKQKRNCSRGNKIALENTNKVLNFG